MDKEFTNYIRDFVNVHELIEILRDDSLREDAHIGNPFQSYDTVYDIYHTFGNSVFDSGNIYLRKQSFYTDDSAFCVLACALKAFKYNQPLIYVGEKPSIDAIISSIHTYVGNGSTHAMPIVRVLMDNIEFIFDDEYKDSLSHMKGKPSVYYVDINWLSHINTLRLYNNIKDMIPSSYTMISYKSNDDFESLYDVVTMFSDLNFGLNVGMDLDRDMFTFRIPDKVRYKIKINGNNLQYILKNLISVGRKRKKNWKSHNIFLY